MPEVQLIHKRFGGPISLEQELTDMAGEFPIWARPFWKIALTFLLPLIKRTKIKRTMREVDSQAEQIGDDWAQYERDLLADDAVGKMKKLFPDAHVERLSMPKHPIDAVYVELPPTPGNKAEELLGFSSIEIHAPFDIKQGEP